MVDANVAVTPGAGALLDTFTQPSGDHRQAVVIGDATTANTARVGAEGGLWVVSRGGVRTNVNLVLEDYAVPTADAGTALAARTVPAGQVLRLQSITATIRLASATVSTGVRLRLRALTTGAATSASPVQFSTRLGNWSVGTQAVGYTMPPVTFTFPEGMEFAAGTGIGFTASAAAVTTYILDVSAVAYEYPAL